MNILAAISELRNIIESAQEKSAGLRRLLHTLCIYLNSYHAIYFENYSDGHSARVHPVQYEISSNASMIHVSRQIISIFMRALSLESFHEPHIINNLHYSQELASLSALSPYNLYHLLIMPLRTKNKVYASILLFRNQKQTVFLERDREIAFGISLYLHTELCPNIIRDQAVHSEHIEQNIRDTTYTDFKHYAHTDQLTTHTHPIALVGESGVGKTHFIKYIHSVMATDDDVITHIDCTLLHGMTIPAFSVESAHTVIMSGVCAISPHKQHYLIQCLRSSHPHIKIFIEVAMSEYVQGRAQGILKVTHTVIFIEPLRNYANKIVDLFIYLWCNHNTDSSNVRACPKITDTAREVLSTHQWDGNINELIMVCTHKRSATDAHTEVIRTIDLLCFPYNDRCPTLKETMQNYKKKYILSVLERYHGNQTQAAKAMHIERTYLNKLLHM